MIIIHNQSVHTSSSAPVSMCVFVYTYVLPYLQAHENKDHVLLVCIILVSTLILGKKKKKDG